MKLQRIFIRVVKLAKIYSIAQFLSDTYISNIKIGNSQIKKASMLAICRLIKNTSILSVFEISISNILFLSKTVLSRDKIMLLHIFNIGVAYFSNKLYLLRFLPVFNSLIIDNNREVQKNAIKICPQFVEKTKLENSEIKSLILEKLKKITNFPQEISEAEKEITELDKHFNPKIVYCDEITEKKLLEHECHLYISQVK